MKIEVDEATRKRAKVPHDLFMINMFLFNLPAVAGLLAYTIGRQRLLVWVVAGALGVSLGIFAYLFRGSALTRKNESWFVAAHWLLATRRARLVLIGYAVAAAIIGLGALIGAGSSDHNMQTILLTVFTRIAVVPALLLILLCSILEGQASHLINNSLVPDGIAKRLPPPVGIHVLDEGREDVA